MKRHLFILCILLGLVGTRASAYDFEVDGYYYNIISASEFTCEVAGYDRGYIVDVKIPATVKYQNRTLSVIRIGDEAFQDGDDLEKREKIRSAIIPNGITSIGKGAFGYCETLKTIVIPHSVINIESNAFSDCRFDSVTIGKSLVSIGYHAFNSGADVIINFSDFDIRPYSHMDYGYPYGGIGYNAKKIITADDELGDYYFRTKDSNHYLVGHKWNDSNIILPDNYHGKTYEIGIKAFSDCINLKSVTIPNSVTSIGDYAFQNCSSLTNITIPESVTSIGNAIFSGCSLTTVTIESPTVMEGGNLHSHIGAKVSKFILNGKITNIVDGTFSGYAGLTDISIPNSVTSIGAEAFSDCNDLTSITIPESVTSIGNSAFSGCWHLTSITIPAGVTKIGENVFYKCFSLHSATIPNSVTSIGKQAFQDCDDLKSITIPNSITTIGNYAFSGCSSLTSVSIPGSVIEVGEHTFEGCKSLKSLNINDSHIPLILSSTDFANCPLEEIYIGRDGFGIAFKGITTLKEITLGEKLTNIENLAFDGCTSLTTLTALPIIPPTLASDAFTQSHYFSANVNVPTQALKAYQSADNWKVFWNLQGIREITGVSLDKNTATLTIGETTTLTATISPTNATFPTVTWTSSNPAIATVENGLVTAVSSGTVTITAKAGEFTAICTVTVNNIAVTGITLDKNTASIIEGETIKLTATVLPEEATDKTVTWASSNPAIATVENGLVTAVSSGTVTITAKAEDFTAICTVTVKAKIIIDKVSVELTEGETTILTAIVLPDNTTDNTVTWTSSNEAIATVKYGTVTAVSAGTATITAKVGKYSATCSVTVKKIIDVTGITLSRTSMLLIKGGASFVLRAAVSPENATDKTVIWSTSDSWVATVDNGIVTPHSTGKATITAKAGNYTAECIVTVIPTYIDVTGITINEPSVSLVEGETITLTATVTPEDATEKDVTWSTSDSCIATVDNGVVTAISEGVAYIRAYAGNYNDRCVVKVKSATVAVSGITIDKTSISLAKGETTTLTATVSPTNATDKTVTWSTSDSRVATVDNGVVRAVSIGTTTITAMANGFTATCVITVTPDEIALPSGEYYLYNAQTQSFLTRGEYWGACACVDKYGIPFYWDSGKGSIKFLDSNLYFYEADPTHIYTDSESSTGFQFVEKDGGYCLESLKTTTYLTLAEGSHGLKTLTTTSDINEATVWVLKSKTEHDAIVTGYTIENYEHVIATAGINSTSDKFVGYLSTCIATDMNSYIGTARFTGNVGNWIYNEVRAQDAQPAYGTDFCELWQATGSYTQTINGLPKGIYKVTMQGFERSGGYVQCNALGEKGYEITTATLKANGEEVNLKSWYSEKSGTNYPNRTGQAVAAFNEGKYMNELYTYVGNDGKLTLIVNKPSHVSDNWMLFNNFTLTYYEEPVEVTSVMLDRYSTELTVGETVTLTAYVYPEDATDKTVTWTSANTAVATVANGVVRAVSAGTTTITAKAGEHTATCTIRVNKKVVNVTGIILDHVSAELTEGETVTLTATVSPDNATDKTVTWTSSDETVATVKDGVVTAIAAGKATITAKAGNYIAACGVTVKAKIIHATNISLDKVSAELTEGETVTLTATVSPDNATDNTVTWTSSDETVATVKDGVVTAIAAGKATITAKTGNYTATCTVTVKAKEIAISSIVLDKNEIEVTDEDEFMLTATIYPENATNEDVVWEIADEEIVINLYQNIFIAIKEGVTTITAKAGDKTATCTVTVKKADGIENSEAEDDTWPADIYDITGRMVKKNATSTNDLEKGIYLIKGRKVIIK